MKKQWSGWVVCGALLMCSAAAVAAQPQDHDQRGQQDQYAQNQRGQDQRGQQDRHGQDQRDQQHGNHGNHRGMYDRGRSEGWYRKGGHMPTEYRGRSYVVTDWRSRHLRQPPRGYHYVRSDNGDFLLVAITTGIIANILASH